MFSFVLCTHGSAFIYVLNIYLCIQLFQIFVHKHLLGFGIKYCKFMQAKLLCLLITKQKLPGVLRPLPYSFNKLINFLSSNLGVPRNDDATPCGKCYLQLYIKMFPFSNTFKN